MAYMDAWDTRLGGFDNTGEEEEPPSAARPMPLFSCSNAHTALPPQHTVVQTTIPWSARASKRRAASAAPRASASRAVTTP